MRSVLLQRTQAAQPPHNIPNKRQHQRIMSVKVTMTVFLWNILFCDFGKKHFFLEKYNLFDA